MNFVHLPGLNSSWAIVIIGAVMLFVTIFAFWYFQRKGWFKTARE
jgi:Mg2+ and Co2+ transporter CorA